MHIHDHTPEHPPWELAKIIMLFVQLPFELIHAEVGFTLIRHLIENLSELVYVRVSSEAIPILINIDIDHVFRGVFREEHMSALGTSASGKEIALKHTVAREESSISVSHYLIPLA